MDDLLASPPLARSASVAASAGVIGEPCLECDDDGAAAGTDEVAEAMRVDRECRRHFEEQVRPR